MVIQIFFQFVIDLQNFKRLNKPLKGEFGNKEARNVMYYRYWFTWKFEKRATVENLVDSPTHWVGESFIYLREFEAIGTGAKLV